MSKFYAYYYIGNQPNNNSQDLNYQQPKLLSMTKIQNEDPREHSVHLHPHLEIFYFESGEGSFFADHHVYNVKAHDMIVVNARTLHEQYSSTETPLLYYCLAVDNLKISKLEKNCISTLPFNQHSFKNKNNPIYRYIQASLTELKSQKLGYLLEIHGILNQILVEICRMFNADSPVESQLPIKNRNNAKIIKQYIDSNYNQDITLSQLCSMIYVSKAALTSLFKEVYGISVMQYLTKVRLSQAQFLLRDTDLSITEISIRVGFNNPTYFSEIFSKHIQLTPSEYRKNEKTKNK